MGLQTLHVKHPISYSFLNDPSLYVLTIQWILDYPDLD